MSHELSIDVVGAPLERAAADLVVAPLFEDERPLRGAAGRVDWRLCGQLSSLVAEGRLAGAPGEAALLVAFAGLRASRLLVVGAGPQAGTGEGALAELIRVAVERVARLGLASMAFPLWGDAASRVDGLAGAAASALAAATDEAQLELRLVVAPEEVLRVSDLLRRTGAPGAPPGVAVRLPAAARSPASRPGSAAVVAPRGGELVK